MYRTRPRLRSLASATETDVVQCATETDAVQYATETDAVQCATETDAVHHNSFLDFGQNTPAMGIKIKISTEVQRDFLLIFLSDYK